MKKCNICSKLLPLDQFYKRNKQPIFACKKCHNQYQHAKQKRVKQLCIEYLGGKCKLCGYSKYYGALAFHHRDPSKKEFIMSIGRNYSFERCKPELDKCDLLCMNCHSETHKKKD